MTAAFRFPDSEIAAQRRIRPTSAECVDLVVANSKLLKERMAREAKIATEATNDTIQAVNANKRPAAESYEQTRKRETDYNYWARRNTWSGPIDGVDGVARIEKRRGNKKAESQRE